MITQELLEQFSSSWERRSMVRRHALSSALDFDADKPDFLSELLPFHGRPAYEALPAGVKSQILTAGWLAYNEKILAVENDVVMRACLVVQGNRPDGLASYPIQRSITETLTDEAYHIRLTLQACEITRERRGLERLQIPPCAMVRSMRAFRDDHAETWQRDLVQIISAIVTEVFVSGFLRSLAKATQIQPLSWITTKAHLMDEQLHSSIFKVITKLLFQRMSQEQQDFFLRVLPMPVYWFADLELYVWDAMLEQLDVPDRAALLDDCRLELGSRTVDCTQLVELFAELGVADVEARILDYGREAARRTSHRDG